MYSFSSPHTTVSDLATCFTASAFSKFMAQHGLTLRTVIPYALMSNGKAERMVESVKAAVCETVLKTGMEWDKALTQFLYGYRRRTTKNGVSPFKLLYRVPPWMDSSANTGASLVFPSLDNHRNLELLAASARRGIRYRASEEQRI